MRLVKFFLCGCVIWVTGCGSVNPPGLMPFYTHIRNQGFEAFQVVQDLNGAGTIVRFSNSDEAIQRWDHQKQGEGAAVQRGDVGEGIQVIRSAANWLPENIIRKGTASIPDFNTSVSVDIDTAAKFAHFPLSGSIKGHQVEKVKLKFGNMSIEQIETGVLNDFLNGYQIDESAKRDATDPNHFIIYEVIKVDKIIYTFANSQGMDIQIDADAVTSIIGGGHLKTAYEISGGASLVIKKPVYIGYKAMRCQAPSAVAKGGILLPTKYQPSDVKKQTGEEKENALITLDKFGDPGDVAKLEKLIQGISGVQVLSSKTEEGTCILRLKTDKTANQLKEYIQKNCPNLALQFEIMGSSVTIRPDTW